MYDDNYEQNYDNYDNYEQDHDDYENKQDLYDVDIEELLELSN